MIGQPLDQLRIRDLAVRCIVGLKPEERRKPQDVVVNVTLCADLRRACRTDRLADSIDYSAVKQRILEAAERSRCHLIERLAQRIADACLVDPRVRAVEVSVQKPGALRFARCSEVVIVRSRPPRPRRKP